MAPNGAQWDLVVDCELTDCWNWKDISLVTLFSGWKAVKLLCESMDRFLQSGTRKKRSATEILTGSTATKRLKTLENPAPDKVFYSRPDKHVKDPGFTVSRWGSLDHDSKHRGDIIPAGFSVERTMTRYLWIWCREYTVRSVSSFHHPQVAKTNLQLHAHSSFSNTIW